ncbi:uncharacterized protein MONBRDRAFT_22430, partial [Monosiga brevicollis MX1]
MEASLRAAELKVFAKAIQCVARIGEDLHLEAKDTTLELKTVSQARNAFARIVFHEPFFEHFKLRARDAATGSIGCCINAKAVLAAFKSLTNIDKTVQLCQLTLDVVQARLVIKLICFFDIVKTYNLYYEDFDDVTVVYSKTDCRNVLENNPRLLLEAVANFQSGLEEICFDVKTASSSSEGAGEFTLENYIEVEEDQNKPSLKTKLELHSSEFLTYQVLRPTRLVFCLQALKQLLSFLDSLNEPMTCHFDHSGRPIIFSQQRTDMSIDFVLATLEHENEYPEPALPSQSIRADSPSHSTHWDNATSGTMTQPRRTPLATPNTHPANAPNNGPTAGAWSSPAGPPHMMLSAPQHETPVSQLGAALPSVG